VSNESRELNEYRIKKFGLNDLADCFISSSFVRLRKPDTDMFKLALDISQVPAEQIIYIDDQLMFVRLAKNFGIHTIHHTDYESTSTKLASFGLVTINVTLIQNNLSLIFSALAGYTRSLPFESDFSSL
jgi:putative hydrolase of the HAD superfamily